MILTCQTARAICYSWPNAPLAPRPVVPSAPPLLYPGTGPLRWDSENIAMLKYLYVPKIGNASFNSQKVGTVNQSQHYGAVGISVGVGVRIGVGVGSSVAFGVGFVVKSAPAAASASASASALESVLVSASASE